MTWIVVGGLAYSGGVVFYAMPRLPFHHTVWHLFVIAGSGLPFSSPLPAGCCPRSERPWRPRARRA